ncbi:PREDICTED: WD repeat-containing protein 44-like [Fragaria vesca subsp. vesca]|uniref:WD repeat-containing protein 44-like n=1 Tax=Fragaria vesca subsp. vesca TaxID=101020 RepID=UPI0002C36A0D|nr:PREDICTED: WD repeat-containing protein 44-like [Fragaria vesca subsp. vesca]
MGSLSEEEFGFFDAHEEIASVSDASGENIEVLDTSSSAVSWVRDSFPYDVWVRSPGSVKERRVRFLDWMEVSAEQIVRENLVEVSSDVSREISRVRESSGAVLRSLSFEGEFSSSRSSMSFWANEFRDGSLSGRMVCNGDEVGLDGKVSEGREVTEESEERTSCSSSSLSHRLSERRAEEITDKGAILKRVKKKWLSRLRSMTCLDDKQRIADRSPENDDDTVMGIRSHRMKVRHSGKRLKELSALYMGQDIQAHEGSIFAMKFSPDGQYLASAGEDGIVRVWQVVENQRCNELDIPEIDPSCIYFTVNHLSELNPLFADKEKVSKARSMRKTSDSACVIFPPKIFRIVDKPLHEFHGHGGEVLDLSWSRNNYLLSSSVDKTVRLWQVGCTDCVKVFAHSNYVTCVQFNPVDDNYFISGSIDGKVRIWGIPCSQVVDYSDVRDIVSAVCYRPDGQGAIVGSMTGICRFYNISDNHLQMDAEICLYSKKKAPCKKITGFEYFPHDPDKVMVTCADSQVRILHGLNVVGKYKGLKNAANLRSATFTSDGKHIISASEDSNVYIWNCSDQEKSFFSQAKSTRSCERFTMDASVAIPWSGLKCEALEHAGKFGVVENKFPETLPFSSPACFSLSQESFLESIPKGSATWPEEKLPTSSPLPKSSTMHRSEYKFFKTSCQSTSSSHAWGMVIVTAGWDGRIKSFHNYGLPVPVR